MNRKRVNCIRGDEVIYTDGAINVGANKFGITVRTSIINAPMSRITELITLLAQIQEDYKNILAKQPLDGDDDDDELLQIEWPS